MKRKTLYLTVLLAYLLGIHFSYAEGKKFFIRINKTYNSGQPNYSKGDKIKACAISGFSWISFVVFKYENTICEWDKLPAE
jgi:hypothetical protein